MARIMVHTAFTLLLTPMERRRYEPGFHEVEDEVAEHWWTLKHAYRDAEAAGAEPVAEAPAGAADTASEATPDLPILPEGYRWVSGEEAGGEDSYIAHAESGDFAANNLQELLDEIGEAEANDDPEIEADQTGGEREPVAETAEALEDGADPLDLDGDGKAGGSVPVTSEKPFDEMDRTELMDFIEARDGARPHHNTGLEKLLAIARKDEA